MAKDVTGKLEAERLFSQLDDQLKGEFHDEESSQFFTDPREFSPLRHVVAILRGLERKDMGAGSDDLHTAIGENEAYEKLRHRRRIVDEAIEKVVTFQRGGLNTTQATMTEVVKVYSQGRDDISMLRTKLQETKSVLTSKKSGQIPLRELWLKKTEIEETLRILKNLEFIKVSNFKTHFLK